MDPSLLSRCGTEQDMENPQVRSFRCLVTGSRDWADVEVIRRELRIAYASAWTGGFEEFVLVHGGCPTGADAIADAIVSNRKPTGPFRPGIRIEVHPADWSLGRPAGPKRNQAMVDLGANLCLAFVNLCSRPNCQRTTRHGSHGASGCAEMAVVAGIPTRTFHPEGIGA